jgi:hypothetical protein
VFLSGWPALAAAAALIAGVTVLGLWWKPVGNPPSDAAPGVASTSARPQASRPLVPEPVAVPPGAESAAVAVEASESQPPAREAEPEAAREMPDSRDVNASPPKETDAGLPASSTAPAGGASATGPDLAAQTGVAEVLPQPAAAPGIPALAPLPPPANRGEFDGRALPAMRTGDSPPPAAAEERTLPSAESQVVAVLGQYQSAYSRLDAASVQEIWPSVDRERLERAFRNLEWQDLEFSTCRVNVSGAAAVATCTGVAEYTTRVGSRNGRDGRTWTFTLRQASESWLIQTVQMR